MTWFLAQFASVFFRAEVVSVEKGATRRHLSSRSDADQPYFALLTMERIFFFECASLEERDAWVGALFMTLGSIHNRPVPAYFNNANNPELVREGYLYKRGGAHGGNILFKQRWYVGLYICYVWF